jgi:hypothetical protein
VLNLLALLVQKHKKKKSAPAPGAQFTCFASTKAQILTQQQLHQQQAAFGLGYTQFTCFTSTKVQILTLHQQQAAS